jgi:hypothetical protein
MAKFGKLRVMFKDPDALSDQIAEHVKDSLDDLGLDADETSAVVEKRVAKVHNMIGEYFEYGEYVAIEIDLDAKPIALRVLTSKEANGQR